MSMHAGNSTLDRSATTGSPLRRVAARVALVGMLAVPVLGAAAGTAATVAGPKLTKGSTVACILCVGGTKV